MKNKKAFTLTELLVALGIIGAIAAMAIPSLLNSINNRIHAVQMKSFTQSMQELINNQLIKYKTKNLFETDFASIDTLLTDSNFDIAYLCTGTDTDSRACWADTYTDINRKNNTCTLRNQKLTSHKNKKSAKLKSGLVFTVVNWTSNTKYVWVDVNGSDAPNICGRDVFGFLLLKEGKFEYVENSKNVSNTSECQGGDAGYCYKALVENNWVMPY